MDRRHLLNNSVPNYCDPCPDRHRCAVSCQQVLTVSQTELVCAVCGADHRGMMSDGTPASDGQFLDPDDCGHWVCFNCTEADQDCPCSFYEKEKRDDLQH